MVDQAAPVVTKIDALRMLSLASDLGVGLAPEHGLRTSYIALRIAQQLGLDLEQQRDVIEVALLKNAGCTSWTTQVAAMIRGDETVARREMLYVREFGEMREVVRWAAKFVGAGSPLPARAARLADFLVSGRDFMREGFESGGEVACRIGERLGASESTRRGLAALFEQWNGKGMPRGLRHEAIPLTSRIVFVAGYAEVAFSADGKRAALAVVRERAGSAFDPTVARAFAELAASDAFWAPLEEGGAVQLIEHVANSAVENLDEFAACCADFVDMKAYWLTGHSRRVAALAERMAHRMALEDGLVRDVRLAALVHDLGLVSVPSFVLNKPVEEQTEEERAAIAGHADVLRSLLARVPAFERIGEIAQMHHQRPAAPGDRERGDGRLVAAGIVAVAAAFDDLTHDAPGAPAVAAEEALSLLTERFAETAFATAAGALTAELTTQSPADAKESVPAGLTPREAEVLKLLASGLSRKQIATRLVLSENTVRSHLEHIYSKLDVTTRVGAVLFALEHGLVD